MGNTGSSRSSRAAEDLPLHVKVNVAKQLSPRRAPSDTVVAVPLPIFVAKTAAGEDWQKPFYREYALQDEIGRGAHSRVYLSKHRRTGRQYAVKCIAQPGNHCADGDFSGMHQEFLAREVAIMLEVRHPYIVPLYEVYQDTNHGCTYLIFECARGGDVMSHMEYTGRRFFSEAMVRRMLQRVLSALAYLHQRGYIHRDVKLENLLLAKADDPSSVLLGDFGFAIQAAAVAAGGVAPCGTPEYCAPEVLRSQPLSSAADVWSAGVATCALLTGVLPFWGKSMDSLLRRIRNCDYSCDGPEWNKVSAGARDFVRCMLQAAPADRWSAQELLKHPWLVFGAQACLVGH